MNPVPHPEARRTAPGSHRSTASTGHQLSPAFYSAAAALLLAGCAATQTAAAVQPQAPGFLLGLWHGFIFPVAWIVSLFMDGVSVYAVPNNGGWYDFGYFLGIVVFGVGARKSATGINGARNGGADTATTTTTTTANVHHEERG